MSDSVRYIHARREFLFDIEPQGGSTVAYVRDNETVRFSYAVCSTKDNYVRSIGRTKALGRLMSKAGPHFTLPMSAEAKDEDVRRAIVQHMAELETSSGGLTGPLRK